MQKPRSNSPWTRRLTTYAVAGGWALLFSAPCLADTISLNPFDVNCTIEPAGTPCPSSTVTPTASGGLAGTVIGSAGASLDVGIYEPWYYKQTAETSETYYSEFLFDLHGDPGASADITATLGSYASLTLHANPYAYGYAFVQVLTSACHYFQCAPPVEYDFGPAETDLYWHQWPPSPWPNTIVPKYTFPDKTLDLGQLEVNTNPPGYEQYGDFMVVQTFISLDMIASLDKPGFQEYGDPSAAGIEQATIDLSATPVVPGVPEPNSLLVVLGVLAAILLGQRWQVRAWRV